MKGRVRLALRTLVGPWFVLPTIAAELAASADHGRPWAGEGLWTVDWFGSVLFLVGPIVAGAAAIDASRLSRPGNVHLVIATPRPWRPYARAAAWCAGPIGLVHVLTIAGGLLSGAVTQPSAGWRAIALGLLVQVLAIVWFAGLGSAVGRFMPPVAAGLVAAVLGFLLENLLGSSGGPHQFWLLHVGGANVSREGLTYDTAYFVTQAGLLAVTAALFIVVPTRSLRSWRAPSSVGIAVLISAAVLVAGSHSAVPFQQRVLPAPQRPTYCFGHAPRVCLFHEHRRYRKVVESNVGRLVSAARAAGYASLVPAQIIESSRTFTGARPGVPSMLLPLDAAHPGLRAWVSQLVYPYQCPQLYALSGQPPPSERFWTRMSRVEQTWLQLAGAPGGSSAGLLSPQQTARIVHQFARCDLAGHSA